MDRDVDLMKIGVVGLTPSSQNFNSKPMSVAWRTRHETRIRTPIFFSESSASGNGAAGDGPIRAIQGTRKQDGDSRREKRGGSGLGRDSSGAAEKDRGATASGGAAAERDKNLSINRASR